MLYRVHGRPLLIGHRGAPAYRPEHSAASYRLALAQGADAVEPDLVPSRDGVLVIRHDHSLAESTDVASRPDFADRRTRRALDGAEEEGWFAEDLSWDELSTLRCREPHPETRPGSAVFDGEQPILRLRDLVELMDADERRHHARLVLEVKTPSLFASQGLDMARLLVAELEALGDSRVLDGLVVESFEGAVLRELRWLGLPAKLVQLVDDERPEARQLAEGADPPSPEVLDRLAAWADGVSPRFSRFGVVDEASAADPAAGRAFVDAAHERGLEVLTWTLRPEDRFLPPAFRGRPEDYWLGLLRTGVDGVFADAPNLVAPLLDDFATPERAARREAEARELAAAER